MLKMAQHSRLPPLPTAYALPAAGYCEVATHDVASCQSEEVINVLPPRGAPVESPPIEHGILPQHGCSAAVIPHHTPEFRVLHQNDEGTRLAEQESPMNPEDPKRWLCDPPPPLYCPLRFAVVDSDRRCATLKVLQRALDGKEHQPTFLTCQEGFFALSIGLLHQRLHANQHHHRRVLLLQATKKSMPAHDWCVDLVAHLCLQTSRQYLEKRKVHLREPAMLLPALLKKMAYPIPQTEGNLVVAEIAS
mmetsp:Transcript_12604/g.27644  ORF Transcript_12604/g.27644 Transcript_12604/m.27644 type:complete len:248 (+) Transcript_12604:125-868(+)